SLHPPSTRICPLSLHDALPISALLGVQPGRVLEREDEVADVDLVARTDQQRRADLAAVHVRAVGALQIEQHVALVLEHDARMTLDRKSTRLNSSHLGMSYAVFC